MKPTPAKPRIIMVQVEGSGAAAASVTVVKNRLSLLAVKNEVAVI
jgi:hypothetical protein